ncbi:MAG: SDR family oxidoreductase, partial [Firmicutes bacterium]|nr:SDR family oxidoreductase [Bacillota bacterium]
QETKRLVEKEHQQAVLVPGDIGCEAQAQQLVDQALKSFGKIDIVVNNAAEQHPVQNIEKITGEQLRRTFATNFFGAFYLTQNALPHLAAGSCIINTASVTAYHGHKELVDYSATKGAMVAFTRSLALQLADKQIRVNAVAPGPIWTPLIPSTFTAEQVKVFGQETPLKRAGQPAEVAPAYVFLASTESSYITGQVIHPNGGEIVNG